MSVAEHNKKEVELFLLNLLLFLELIHFLLA